MRRALTFGSVAQAYERFRPGYPDELADEVLAYAGRPVRTALEIGAGTGKATRLFAARGVAVTATEPDAAMLDELRVHVPVATVRATFEDLPTGPVYDLVYAAAALHWTDPTGRWERVVGLLEPDGVFASFGGPFRLADPALEQAARDAHAPWLATDDVPAPDGTPTGAAMQWPGTELLASPLFTDVRQLRIERRMTLSAAGWIGHLSTVSAYLALPPDDRRRALAGVEAVLPARVDVIADLDVHLARRA